MGASDGRWSARRSNLGANNETAICMDDGSGDEYLDGVDTDGVEGRSEAERIGI
jgi:hypothetical protein